MSRLCRLAAVLAALALVLAACSEPKATGLPTGPTPEPASLTRVQVVDNLFVLPELDIKPGEEVTWVFVGSQPHNVQAVDGSFNSHPGCGSDINQCSKQKGPEFRRVFPKPGEFAYYCVIHGQPNNPDDPQNMFGRIVVKP